jgi:hypothetical protein
VLLNKGQKLVKMLELMTRRGGVRASELVERFELDARTLRRYLADMRELDLPVRDEGRGDDRLITIDGPNGGDIRSIVVMGDDLTPGKHILTFTPPPGKKGWVHLPWTVKPRLPGTPPPPPHWLEGDLEE